MNNPELFERIFHDFYPSLCFYAQRFIQDPSHAEDIVEELFTKLWVAEKEFESEGHLKSLLYKATKNACLDFLKTSQHSGERNAIFYGAMDKNEKSHLNEMIRAEVVREVHQALEALPEQCGKVIRKSYIEGLTNQEIADELSLSIQTVKNHKLRGLAMLRKRISQDQFMLLMLYPHLSLITHFLD